MSKSKYIAAALFMLLPFLAMAQIRNAKTETVKIYGNCGMCKNTIEKAGSIGKESSVQWDRDSKTATITYNPDQTNTEAILKQIALAGYDNEQYLAPDDVYSRLPACCQYERVLKPAAESPKSNGKQEHAGNHQQEAQVSSTAAPDASRLQPVFYSYFSLKDALVQTDAGTASSKAEGLAAAIKAVDMNLLSAEEHTVWMKVMKNAAANAESISRSKDISIQRKAFASLSENMYELAKVSGQDTPVYYQHCPMYNDGKGANWLSKESTVRNPYYGSQMMSCGKTVETIK